MLDYSILAGQLELVWWLFTAILAAGIVYPILNRIDSYPFLLTNVMHVIIFVTFTRYIFLLQYTFLAYRTYWKSGLIVLCIPLFFYQISDMNTFQAYMGEEGLETFMPNLDYPEQESLGKYIRNEMVLFGTGSTITIVLLPFRLILSIWRGLNRGTV